MLLRLIILALVWCQPPQLVWARSRFSDDSQQPDLSTSLANDGAPSITLWALEPLELGSLYDSNSQQFLNTSIFLDDRDGLHRDVRIKKSLNKPIEDEGIVRKTSNFFKLFQFDRSQSLGIRMDQVNLDENNILTPVIKSLDLNQDPRTGAFKNPSRMFQNTATHKYWYEYLKTSQEYLDLKNRDAKYLIDFEKLREYKEATHVIVGITKGAGLIIKSKAIRQSRRRILSPDSVIYSDVPLNLTATEQRDSNQRRQQSIERNSPKKPLTSIEETDSPLRDDDDADEGAVEGQRDSNQRPQKSNWRNSLKKPRTSIEEADPPLRDDDDDEGADDEEIDDEEEDPDQRDENDPDDRYEEVPVKDRSLIKNENLDDDDDDDLIKKHVSNESQERFLVRRRRQAPRRRSSRKSSKYSTYSSRNPKYSVDDLKTKFRDAVKESDPSKTIQYSLISIRDLLKYFPEQNQLPEFDDPTSFSSKSIDPSSYEEARDILDGINSVGRHLGLFLGRMKSYKKYLNHVDIGKGEILQRSFLKTNQLFKQGLREAIDAYKEEQTNRPIKSRSRSRSRPQSRSESRQNRRSSNSRRLKRQAVENEFETLFDNYYDSLYSFENVNKTLNNDFGHVREKIKLLAKIDIHRNKQVKYLGKEKSFKNIPLIPANGAKSNPGYDSSLNEIYLLYFKEDLSKVPDNLRWRQTRADFVTLSKKRAPTNFDRQLFLIDCDFAYLFEVCDVLQEPVIHRYLGGELVSTDYPHSDTVDVPSLTGPTTTTTEAPNKPKQEEDLGDTLTPLVIPPSIDIFNLRPTQKTEMPVPESECNIITGVITSRDKAQILDEHNKYRQYVARGLERRGNPGPQPPSSNMRALSWDNELARAAQDRAGKCGSEPERRTGQFVNVGQNIKIKRTPWVNGSPPVFDSNWKDVILGWYNEVQDFDSRDVDSLRDPNTRSSQGDTSHYTQLVWAKTTKVGCAYSQYLVKDKEIVYPPPSITYVCNYGNGGNVIGQPVYRRSEERTPIDDRTSVEIPETIPVRFIPAPNTQKTVFDPETGTWGVLQPEKDPKTDTSVHPFWLTNPSTKIVRSGLL